MKAVRAVVTALVATLLLAGCTGAPDEQSGSPSVAESPSPTASETPTEPPDPGPTPKVGQCHALSFRQAVAVVGRTEPVACREKHTAQTYFVGRLRLETPAGKTRRVDSDAAQRQARDTCTSRLPRHLGVGPNELRLKMAQAVWFTPSTTHAEAGADWFRCDVVAVAAPRQLLTLPRQTTSWGEAPAIAMCATAAPGTKAFRRVGCGARHAWLAVATVDLAGKTLPPPAAIADRMESTCREAARSRAADPLDFTWSQESPTKEQWKAGQHYGICWVPA